MPLDIDSIVTNLEGERHRAWSQQKAVFKAAENRNGTYRALTADEKQVIARTDELIDGYDEDIRRWKDRRDREALTDELRADVERIVKPAMSGTGRPGENDAIRGWLQGGPGASMEVSFRGVIGHKVNRDGVVEFVEHRSGAYERRDLLVGTSASGGYTVPRHFVTMLYQHLVEETPAFRMGVHMIELDHGRTIDWPKTAAYGTAAIVGEGTAIAESDPAFGTLSLGAWKYGQLLQISSELLEDEDVELEPFVSRQAAVAISNGFGPHFATGNGSSKPYGILPNHAYGTGVTGQASATGVPSYENVVDMVYSVGPQYRPGSLWYWRDASVAAIRKIRGTDGHPLWQPGMGDQPDTLMGYPIVTDPNCTAMGSNVTCGAFGDFERGVVLRRTPVRFEKSADYAFANDLVSYRTLVRMDSKPNDTAAVKLYVGGS